MDAKEALLQHFAQLVAFLPPFVLFLGAVAGHLALLSVSLNIWYGHPFPKPFLGALRKLHTLLVPVGPVAFYLLYGFDLDAAWTPAPVGWQCVPALWLAASLVTGLTILPMVTLLRWLRVRPAAVLSNHTHTLDVAAKLGWKPIGDGKKRLAAHLPYNEIFQVDCTEKTFHLPHLPAAWDGLTILHLTDLHFCGTPDRRFYFEVMDRCRDWQPDLVAITGDIVDGPRHHRWLLPILGRLRWQVAAFAILGNHDKWYDPPKTRRRLGKLGIRVLGNGWQQLAVRGQPLTVIGHEGPWFRPEPDLTQCPPEGFRLCLSHTPDNLPWARRHQVDLMLAGHVHGGQIRIPGIGSILVPSRYSRRYDCGTFHEPPTLLHVSRGLAGQHPVRYFCKPEVTKIVLRNTPV